MQSLLTLLRGVCELVLISCELPRLPPQLVQSSFSVYEQKGPVIAHRAFPHF
jgi:hypothetical protein